jgi:hypothetical protein
MGCKLSDFTGLRCIRPCLFDDPYIYVFNIKCTVKIIFFQFFISLLKLI